jgi:acyl carrier protein
LPDGNIEFLGRIDHQVKIRGFRIEIGEIETWLRKKKEIKEVIVTQGEKRSGEKYLSAYFVSENKLETHELRDYLAGELPHYMVPAYFVQIDKLPLTPNGKIDRKRLPEPDPMKELGYVAPGNDKEKTIALTWKTVLELEKVGAEDNFFDLGGNSIDFIRISSKLKEAFNRDIPVVILFKYPTIRSLAKYLSQENYNRMIDRSVEKERGRVRAKDIRIRKKLEKVGR